MRKHLLAAIAALALLPATAKADLVITSPNGATGTFDANVLFTTQSTDVTTANGFSNGSGQPQIITFTSTDAFNTSASGQADITPFSSTFNNLTLNASGTATAFTSLLLDIVVPVNEMVTFTSPTFITSGATQQLSANGNNFILVTAENGETFSTLHLSTTGNISDIRQTRVDIASAVPETSTWAMMVLGFAGVGFLAYRRRASSSASNFRSASNFPLV
jgi:hypothetical protein